MRLILRRRAAALRASEKTTTTTTTTIDSFSMVILSTLLPRKMILKKKKKSVPCALYVSRTPTEIRRGLSEAAAGFVLCVGSSPASLKILDGAAPARETL